MLVVSVIANFDLVIESEAGDNGRAVIPEPSGKLFLLTQFRKVPVIEFLSFLWVGLRDPGDLLFPEFDPADFAAQRLWDLRDELDDSRYLELGEDIYGMVE